MDPCVIDRSAAGLSHGHHLANDVCVIVSRLEQWGMDSEKDTKLRERKTDLVVDAPEVASFGQCGVFAVVE